MCTKLFPSIDPYTAENVKEAIKQFEKTNQTIDCLTTTVYDTFVQGDIFTEIPFSYVDADGTVRIIKACAQLLTNSCDATRNKNLLFAALLPLNEYEKEGFNATELKKNLRYDLIYYPDTRTVDKVVDLGVLTTFSRELFEKMVSEKKVSRIASLSQMGYYLLLSKLTVYLLRPESAEIKRIE